MKNEPVTQIGHRPLAVKTFGITDKGRVRASNEDQFLIAELTKTMRIWQTSLPEPRAQFGEERGHLFLVADGMGGHRAGEQASALAVVAIEQFTLNTFKWFFDANGPEAQRVLAQFQTALRQADERILEEAAEHPELSGMGTTLTMAYHLDAQLCVVHVGDSRAYVYAGWRAAPAHARSHARCGAWSARECFGPTRSRGTVSANVITNVVGGTEAGVYVEAHALEVQAGDRSCSVRTA